MSTLPCAIYTRKSSEEGLEQGFNSLDAQREACEAYILSQKALGWKLVGSFDDGGFSGGNVERPGLKKLLAEITARRVRVVVVYKVDRLTRSLADFAKLVELFDAHGVSFVSVTQAFNTTTSMGRLTLNVLLSFAQFEREVTGERIRDKIAASKKKGMWMGGFAPIGYGPHERSLAIDDVQAERVREIFRLYRELESVDRLHAELQQRGWRTPARVLPRPGGDRPFTRGHLYRILGNPVYIGQIVHKGVAYPGQHLAIVEPELWQAVQERLSLNLHGHRCKTNAKEPSLLAGLVFDDQGTRLAPSHATKGSRRYRYYVRQDKAASDDVKPLRVPAPELEDAVTDALEGFLTDEARLLGLMGSVDADRVRSRLQGAAGLAEGMRDAGGRIDRVQRLVARVALGANAIEVTVRVAAIWLDGVDESSPSSSEPMLTTLTVPAQLKRCGQAVRLIVKAAVDPKNRLPDQRLLGLLAKAQGWFRLLSSGQADSVLSIAQAHRMASADVTRVVYLAFLAPDIVQTIVRGAQPQELNIKRMLAAAPLPMDWAEQRRVLGFDG